MTEIIRTVAEWRQLRQGKIFKDRDVGFVATMGALHAGHRSLLQRARAENAISVLSIFVNPAQFDDPNDLKNYPKTLDADVVIAKAEKVDYLLLPEASEIYHDNYRYQISESKLSKQLCGAHRPGHFDGVLTVVLKLLQLVKPSRAYFGEKDYQQLLLVQEMVKAFFLDITIVPCPIVRDEDGLALSSRNRRLTAQQRQLAIKFAQLLQSDLPIPALRTQLESFEIVIDYIEDYINRRLAAVKIGPIRLIDNKIIIP